MNNTRSHAPSAVALNIDIHPELRKGLRQRALAENLSAKEKLHRLLCEELGRSDLINQIPVRPNRQAVRPATTA